MKRLLFLVLASISLTTFAQTFTLNVWNNKIPGSKECEAYQEKNITIANGGIRISNVKKPQIIGYLPEKNKSTGTAIIIMPGGSYRRLAIDHEGTKVAQWLSENGIAGIVLKYRLPDDSIMEDKSSGPLMDIQEALRIVRRNATRWGIDPNKIGVIGFSAGGHLAGSASTLFNYKTYEASDTTSCRPNFSVLIYGALSFQEPIAHKGSRSRLLGDSATNEQIERFSAERNVTANTPPAFLVHAIDDKTVPVNNSILYMQALKEHNIPVELHLYQSGGHGFGMGRKEGTESAWPDACLRWLKSRGF
jgi:acetyl esterase/lipase